MRKHESVFTISILVLLLSLLLPISSYAQTENNIGTLKITTTPAGADVYIDGERYIQKCTPCTIALDEGNHEIKLSIIGYEEFTKTVLIETDNETIVEKKLLPNISIGNPTIVTVTTEEDTEDDFNNTTVTVDELNTMGKVSLRLAMNAIQNDTTDRWYRIEFAENVNHIELVNHYIDFARDNLIINGDKNRDGIPDVWITQSNWGILFRPMNNLYIAGLRFGEENKTECAFAIRPYDNWNGDVNYNNIYLLGCEFTNCEVIPFCGACKVYDSNGKVDYTNINACGNVLYNSNLFFAYSGNVDYSVTDGLTYQANQLDYKSLLTVMCADCNTNYIYGGQNEASNGTSCELDNFETSDYNTVKNILICGNSGGFTTFGTAVNGNSYNTISNAVVRNNYIERGFSPRVCQPIGERNEGNTLIMKGNSLQEVSFNYNIFDFSENNETIWLRVLAFDPGDNRCKYILEDNYIKNISFNNNLLLGNDIYIETGHFNGAHTNNIEAGIDYEVESGFVVAKAGILCDDKDIIYTNVNNRFDGKLLFDANRKVKIYNPYDIWDDSPVHIHSPEYISGTDSTCKEYGREECYLCPICGRHFTDWLCDNEIEDYEEWLNTEGRREKAAHREETLVTKATLSSNGKKEIKCSECGEAIESSIIYSPKAFVLSSTSYTYDGKAHNPTVTVRDSNGNLIENTHYTVDYINSMGEVVTSSINAGTYKVRVTFTGDYYSGTKDIDYTINSKSGLTVSLSYTSKAYTGSTLEPAVMVKNALGAILVSGTDYTVEYLDSEGKSTEPKDVGTYTVKITMKGNYSGIISNIYKIVPQTTIIGTPANASKGIIVKWSKNTSATGYYIYRSKNGAAYKKVKTITRNKTASWKDTGAKTNGAKYQYKIEAYTIVNGEIYTSAYSSAKTICFLSRPAISSLANSSNKKIAVKWSKNSKGTGYQIQYSLKSNFSNAKSTTVKSNKTVTKTIANLAKGKTYYVRIRTYKAVKSTKYYSEWSAKKKVKITK